MNEQTPPTTGPVGGAGDSGADVFVGQWPPSTKHGPPVSTTRMELWPEAFGWSYSVTTTRDGATSFRSGWRLVRKWAAKAMLAAARDFNPGVVR